MTKKIRMECGTCGSGCIVLDAVTTWDFDKQEWTLADYGDYWACADCGEEKDINEVEVEVEDGQDEESEVCEPELDTISLQTLLLFS